MTITVTPPRPLKSTDQVLLVRLEWRQHRNQECGQNDDQNHGATKHGEHALVEKNLATMRPVVSPRGVRGVIGELGHNLRRHWNCTLLSIHA